MTTTGGVGGFTSSQFRRSKTTFDLVKALATEAEEIKNPCNVTAWMDMVRSCRQPQNMWIVDYIEPREELLKANDIIRKSEIVLYGDNRNLILKKGYTADIYQEIAFHTIRAHLRAEEGKIDLAIEIFQELLNHWYDRISIIRQSNLLFHCCLAFLCCSMFEESYKCFDRHWSLLKYLPPSERIGLGIWDNQVILQTVYWFFVFNVDDFKDFYSLKLQCHPSKMVDHKKVALMNFLEYDASWVVSFCGLPFYEVAQKKFKLPKYDRKRSTPVNHIQKWTNDGFLYTDSDKPAGWERYYFEAFNRETEVGYVSDIDQVNSSLYSYYHFQADYIQEQGHKSKLFDFTSNGLPEEIFSIVEAGCGAIPTTFPQKIDVTLVDIAEHVCTVLKEKGADCVHRCISTFTEQNTNNTYDLCFAPNILQCLSKPKLDLFLNSAPSKYRYIAASINVLSNIKTDIVSKLNISAKEVELHRTIFTHEEWLSLLSEHFEILKQEIKDEWLYVCCKTDKDLYPNDRGEGEVSTTQSENSSN